MQKEHWWEQKVDIFYASWMFNFCTGGGCRVNRISSVAGGIQSKNLDDFDWCRKRDPARPDVDLQRPLFCIETGTVWVTKELTE